MPHVYRIDRREPDVAIDAASRIPARVGLRGIVDADGDDVVAGAEMFGDVVGESDVAVRTAAQEYTVDPDVTVHVHAIEFQPRLDPRARVDPERLAIPPDAGGEIADAPAAGRDFGRCAFDTPIVRQIERAPARVVERPVLRTVGIAEGEAPRVPPSRVTKGATLYWRVAVSIASADLAGRLS